MNNNEIVSLIIEAYRRVITNKFLYNSQKSLGTKHKKRSNRFINFVSKNLIKYFREVYNDVSIKFIVFSGTENNKKNFRKNEILYDIHVCEYDTFQSLDKNETIHYITKSVIQIESEFRKDIQHSIEDFNKLVCGNAPIKIMVLPLNVETYHNKFKLLAHNVQGELYLVYIPHPEAWANEEVDNFKVFKYINNDWKEETIEVKTILEI